MVAAAALPVMLDNLIHERRVPPTVAVLLAPGPGGQRTIESDTVSDRYVNFVETEVLPRITRDYQVAFTADPDARATFGESSRAAAALTMASGHVDRRVHLQTMPEAFEWVRKGYQPSGR